MQPWSQQSPTNKSPASNAKQGNHEKLREYETRRRLAYSSKHDSMALYWKSYCDLLSASLQETGRAKRLVLGTCRAHQLYSNAMQAMYDDTFLDEKGNVANDKQQKRLASVRRKPKMWTKGGESDVKSSSAVSEIREAQHVMAQKFGENAKNMDEEIAEAISSLLDLLQRQCSYIENVGSNILNELQKTEEEVTQAWGAYLPKASPSSAQETAPKGGDNADAWIVEMQYRVAVAYQNTAWEKGTTELTKLFSTVKQEECLRRINLREFLVAFVQRQQRVFLSLPGIHNSVLEDLVDKKMTKEDIEKLIEATIENQASNYKKSADTASSGSAPSSKGADNILDVHLESPLSSDLTCKAKVIQRKSSATSGWKTSLAIMTVDSYLHLFDIENAEPEISPEDAFQSIIPNVIMPDSQNVLMGKANFSKGWSDSLTPSDSLILGNCKILSLDSTTFELTETVASTGASRMLGKSVVKKVLFRTLTKEEADDWITVLLS